MITPAFIGQIYINTLNSDVWQANSLTPGDWTKIAGAGSGSNLDGAGDPTGIVTPDYLGQYYRDTATGNIWKSTGTTSADWVLTVQDMLWRWTPDNEKFGELMGVSSSWSTLGNVTNIVSLASTFAEMVNIASFDNLVSASFPNLISVDPTSSNSASFSISGHPLLSNISLPLLAILGGGNENIFSTNNILSVLSFPSLTLIDGDIKCEFSDELISFLAHNLITITGYITLAIGINGCPKLSTIDLSSYLPTNEMDINIKGCALTTQSVEHVLTRCVANAAFVSGIVDLSGGTSVSPLQGAGTPHDTLVARGVTINHN